MLDTILAQIAPHHCLVCDRVADGLCAACKDSIQPAVLTTCCYCRQPLRQAVCAHCQLAGVAQYIPYQYDGAVEQLLQAYKFSPVRAYSRAVAQLLADHIPRPPGKVVFIPTPSSPERVRQRGFDHIAHIVRHLKKSHHADVKPLLRRTKKFRQVGATRAQRFMQASGAFVCPTPLSPATTCIIVDDVITTGATMCAQVAALRQAGATHIAIAAIAYQPLDSDEKICYSKISLER